MAHERLQTHGIATDELYFASAANDRLPMAAPVDVAPRLGGLLDGTGVLTRDGYRPVEQLRHGDLVATFLGRGPMFVPIIWVGRRRMLAAIDRAPLDVPVRIRRHAVADNMPNRDIRVAPDHALYITGRLYTAQQLINGATLLWTIPRIGPHYWAIQLERHDIVLADGLPVETLADQAARAAYETVDGPQLRLVSRAEV
jgi:hypothetical protein